jgi:6-phosphogluconolactonase
MPSSQGLLYISTYTGPVSGEAPSSQSATGLYLFNFDHKNGFLQPVAALDIGPNPSYITFSADGRYLYAVNELDTYEGQPGGSVCAFSVDPQTGLVNRLNIQPTHGGAPCYIGLDPSGTIALVANYNGGNVATYAIHPDGQLGTPALVTHTGHGPNADRQQSAHAHCAIIDPSNRYAFVVDLGIDRVKIYDIDFASSQLRAHQPPEIATAPGAGPRHLVYHARHPFAYLINELDSTIGVYHYDVAAGTLHQEQTISTLPDDFRGQSTAAHILIAPSGRFLYASNRGYDSIAIFAIDEATGHLSLVGMVPTEGRTPRYFTIDPTGRWLLVGNQNGDNVVTFRVDVVTGHLTRSGEPLTLPKPSCLVFA